jgi:hypothetical protein
MSAGTLVTDDQARQFQRGVTPESYIVAKLGQPNGRTIKDDGTIVDAYVYTHAAPDAVDFVPIIGTLAGGAHGKTLTVTFTFDSKGIYQSYSSSTSNIDVRTGLVNQ